MCPSVRDETFRSSSEKFTFFSHILEICSTSEFIRFCRSTDLWVMAFQSDCGTHLVPMSALLFSVFILTNIQLLFATLPLTQPSMISMCLRFRVMCVTLEAKTHAALSSSMGVVSWIQPMVFSIPLHATTSGRKQLETDFESDSHEDNDIEPWSVLVQQIRSPPRYTRYDVCVCMLSRLPLRSASHWKRSWSWAVIAAIS
jgi:hypothetical protein